LLPFLFATLNDRSKTTVKSLLRHGQVLLNGKPTTHFDAHLRPGDVIGISSAKTSVVTFRHSLLSIAYEDADIIVVNKGAGLLAVSDPQLQQVSAHSLLIEYVRQRDSKSRVFILHRLDKYTSGLMMFALTREAQERLRSDWYNMITRRAYTAIVEGCPARNKDTLVTYLTENKRMKVYCTDPQHGKEAVSHYRVIKSVTDYSLLEVELETGRKNQIRAQMEYIGHPVVGDLKYGATVDPVGRLMLHANCLCFIHPATGLEMRFTSPPPKDFKRFFDGIP
jgi:23S rRNA pseudouridine1911/1915/1917 synthase